MNGMLYMTFSTLTWTANCVPVPWDAGADTGTSLIARGGDGAISTDNYDERRSSGFYGSVCEYGRVGVKLVWGTEKDSWRNEVLATMWNNFLFWQRPLNLERRQGPMKQSHQQYFSIAWLAAKNKLKSDSRHLRHDGHKKKGRKRCIWITKLLRSHGLKMRALFWNIRTLDGVVFISVYSILPEKGSSGC